MPGVCDTSPRAAIGSVSQSRRCSSIGARCGVVVRGVVVRRGSSRRRVRGWWLSAWWFSAWWLAAAGLRGVVVRRLCRQGLYRPGRPSDPLDQRLIPPLACPWCMAPDGASVDRCTGGMDPRGAWPVHAPGAWIAVRLARSCAGGMDRGAPGPFMRGGHGSRGAWPVHAPGAWIAVRVARSCAGGMDRDARARPDRPTPWADALIDTPR